MPTIDIHEVVHIPTGTIHEAPWNANVVTPEKLEKIRRSLKRYGSVENNVVRPSWCMGARNAADVAARRAAQMDPTPTSYETLSGNHRLKLYRDEGVPAIPCTVVELSDPEAKVLAQVLNRTRGEDDPVRLADLLKDAATEIPLADMASLLPQDERAIASLLESGGRSSATPSGGTGYQPISMVDQFVVPPFSVLDARQGYWRERKRAWIGLGIRSELGRDGRLTFNIGPGRENWNQSGGGLLGDGGANSVYHGSSEWAGYRGPNKEGQPPRRAAAYSTDTSGMVSYTGTSIFDPVLCELAYRWFTPPGGVVLDPFAGGSVRGVVAALLGRRYVGIDLRAEQVAANDHQWQIIRRRIEGGDEPDNIVGVTPVERAGDYWFKRDDLFCVGGVQGGKVRTCWHLAQGAKGLVTAGSRMSPQCNIVAHVAKALGIPCRIHVPSGDLSPELKAAEAVGAEVVQHRPGYNTVIIARAREDAAARGWMEIPFGMECAEAAKQTASQARTIPAEAKRLVVPVGSGMSLAGILTGMKEAGITMPVLGVQVGADPTERLNTYAPEEWQGMVTLVKSDLDYHAEAPETILADVKLDPIYEAKCIPFMEPGDCLWVVGIRQTAIDASRGLRVRPAGERRLTWKFSAAWGRKQVNCTLDGIQKVCGGGCCKGTVFWPSRANGNVCKHLGEAGCTLPEPNKPITCLLYPLLINKSGTVILHHKVTTKTAPCGDNYGNGPMVIEAVAGHLTTLFGQATSDRIVAGVKAGQDVVVDVPDVLAREWERERGWERANIIPGPRREVRDLPLAAPVPDEMPAPTWVTGDARDVATLVPNLEVDFVFSCPPYADLEVYSDDPRDLSTLGYDEFIRDYGAIVKRSCALLKEDRFACFVVGDLRDSQGNYRNFPAHTIQAFLDAGLKLYNEAVLVTSVGSLPLRAGRAFKASRKLGKGHQNVLIFAKGDPVKAAQACGSIDVTFPGEEEPAAAAPTDATRE